MQQARKKKDTRMGKAEISITGAGDMIVVVENHDQLSVFPACTLPMNSELVYSVAESLSLLGQLIGISNLMCPACSSHSLPHLSKWPKTWEIFLFHISHVFSHFTFNLSAGIKIHLESNSLLHQKGGREWNISLNLPK